MRAEGEETEEQQDEGLGFWQKREHGRAGVFERDDKSTPLGWRKEISLPFPGGRRWLFRGPQECKKFGFTLQSTTLLQILIIITGKSWT